MEIAPYIFLIVVLYGIIHVAVLIINFKRKNKFCPDCHTKMKTKIVWEHVKNIRMCGARFKEGYSGKLIRYCPKCPYKIEMNNKNENVD